MMHVTSEKKCISAKAVNKNYSSEWITYINNLIYHYYLAFFLKFVGPILCLDLYNRKKTTWFLGLGTLEFFVVRRTEQLHSVMNFYLIIFKYIVKIDADT